MDRVFATFIVLESSNMPLLVPLGQAPNEVVLGAVGNQLQCLHQLWCTRGHVITSIHVTMDSWRTDANKPSLLKVSLPRLTSSALLQMRLHKWVLLRWCCSWLTLGCGCPALPCAEQAMQKHIDDAKVAGALLWRCRGAQSAVPGERRDVGGQR